MAVVVVVIVVVGVVVVVVMVVVAAVVVVAHPRTSSPLMRTDPSDGSKKRNKSLSTVDLPDPLPPTMAIRPPAGTENDRSLKISLPFSYLCECESGVGSECVGGMVCWCACVCASRVESERVSECAAELVCMCAQEEWRMSEYACVRVRVRVQGVESD